MKAHAPLFLLAVCSSLSMAPSFALAWGDTGHQVVALIARAQLTPRATAAVDRLLQSDTSPLKMRDGGMTSDSWARQATWADYYRAMQGYKDALPNQVHTYAWHFVDIEIEGGSLATACFDFPQPAAGTVASSGPDPDCVVNKIEQFEAELASGSVPDSEKLLALKFLMHFVGDLHQPLHAADKLDRGGNTETATVGTKSAALHSHWDTTFVEQIGSTAGAANIDPQAIASALRKPSAVESAQWLGTTNPRAWALESYALAQNYAYGDLPQPTVTGTKATYALDAGYVRNAGFVVQDQLLRAGYRLAALLNSALSK